MDTGWSQIDNKGHKEYECYFSAFSHEPAGRAAVRFGIKRGQGRERSNLIIIMNTTELTAKKDTTATGKLPKAFADREDELVKTRRKAAGIDEENPDKPKRK